METSVSVIDGSNQVSDTAITAALECWASNVVSGSLLRRDLAFRCMKCSPFPLNAEVRSLDVVSSGSSGSALGASKSEDNWLSSRKFGSSSLRQEAQWKLNDSLLCDRSSYLPMVRELEDLC